jgi:hypothetical protein
MFKCILLLGLILISTYLIPIGILLISQITVNDVTFFFLYSTLMPIFSDPLLLFILVTSINKLIDLFFLIYLI